MCVQNATKRTTQLAENRVSCPPCLRISYAMLAPESPALPCPVLTSRLALPGQQEDAVAAPRQVESHASANALGGSDVGHDASRFGIEKTETLSCGSQVAASYTLAVQRSVLTCGMACPGGLRASGWEWQFHARTGSIPPTSRRRIRAAMLSAQFDRVGTLSFGMYACGTRHTWSATGCCSSPSVRSGLASRGKRYHATPLQCDV